MGRYNKRRNWGVTCSWLWWERFCCMMPRYRRFQQPMEVERRMWGRVGWWTECLTGMKVAYGRTIEMTR
jgi:hypothetical protein